MALNLVTDREVEDVNRWKNLCSVPFDSLTLEEQTEWKAGLKGAYNYTDLNRVENAVFVLAAAALDYITNMKAYLRARGVAEDEWFFPYRESDVVTHFPEGGEGAWIRRDIPTPEQMADYLANITMLRGLLPMPPTTPPVPGSMGRLQYWEANDIEQILLDVDAVRDAWQEQKELEARYVGNYNYQLISGTFYAGNHRTLQHYSRGR